MDPFISGVLVAIGKYVVDKTADAIPAMGAEASKLLEKMYRFIVDKLSNKGTSEKVIVEEYEKDPATYEKPLAKILEEEFKRNPAFAEELQRMVDEYNQKLKSEGASESYAINVKGSITSTGSVFGSGSVSAGGDIVGGDKSK